MVTKGGSLIRQFAREVPVNNKITGRKMNLANAIALFFSKMWIVIRQRVA